MSYRYTDISIMSVITANTSLYKQLYKVFKRYYPRVLVLPLMHWISKLCNKL